MQRATLISAFFLAVLILAESNVSFAGPNENGVLILHREFYLNLPGECSFGGADLCECSDLESCDDADTEADSSDLYAMWTYMAFPQASTPRVKEVRFGVDYDNTSIFLSDFGGCADVETPDGSWPAPGTGTVLAFDQPREGTLELAYFFVGYEYYGESRLFEVTPHPSLGGVFLDDAVPPAEDEIVDYGAIGFNMAGRLPCPQDPTPTQSESWGSVKSTFR